MAYQNNCKFIVAQEEENELAGYGDWLKARAICDDQRPSTLPTPRGVRRKTERQDDGDSSRFSGHTVQQPVNTGEGHTLNAGQSLIPSNLMVTSFAICRFPRRQQFDKGKQVVNEKEQELELQFFN
ncbi:hypothetical protein GBA52_003556 [Prunus armeniaca]|nr:hypothetical protein GBA52_003556 [Prunus armeniaca]